MGLLQRIKQSEANKTRKKAMKMVKRVQLFVKGVFAAVKILPIMTAAVVVTTTLGTVISFITDISASDGTAKKTYEALEVQDLSELVEIKEDGNDGYYIDFKEDATEKLKSLTKTINKDVGSHNVPKDEEFLKEMIKAELITKFPNLGGTVPEDSEGFQGAVDLRRISPDKEIEELTQASNGETANIEQEETNDPNEDIGAYEDIVKGWKTGQELVVTKKAYAYEQQESTLNPGQGTGNWKNVYDSKENKVEIDKDTKVTYTGKYETNTNQSTKLTSTYVQVKIDEERTYFLKAQYLSTESKKDNESEARSITRTVEKTAKVTSRAKEEKETLGSSSKTYKIALRAVAGDGIETEELNEKELAEKVLNKLKKSLEDKYSNVEVSEADTRKEIREIDPDFAIVINFNIDTDKSKSGVDAIYRDGDEPSHQLGDILSANVAKSMGLTDLYAGSDLERIKSDLTAIDHFVTTEYPTALVRGGYFSSDNDVKIIKDNGVNKYAEGLLNGIEEYVKSDKSGYEAKKEQEKTAKDSIKSKVVKMKYVTPDKFKEYVESNSQEALKVYTLNDQFQIQTATWSSENGDIKISENTAIDFRTALQKYIMPYEYLLFFYTDSDYEDFSLELAKTAQEAEIVIALQDNVETKKTVVTTNEKKTITPKKYNSEYGYGWKETNTETTTTETCSTKVEYTYINTWCVKLYKESSYSSKILNMGDKDEIDGIDLKGTATYTKQTSETTAATKDEGEIQVADGLQTTPNGNDTIKYVKVKYKTQEKTETDIDTYNHNYDTGETKIEGKENVFVDLYQEKKMKNRIRPKWLFKILEKNEKTSNMVDLTKYLIYKATSIDYGVVEYDFNIFNLDTFSDATATGDLATFKEYLHQWEGHEGISADGTKYRVGDDGAGHPTVGYGVDIYNSGYLDRFLAAGYDVSMGAYIDKDFVDTIEDEEIQSKLQGIEKETAGLNLTIYQKYALLSRAYNCGTAGALKSRNGKTFVQAYNAYWNQERDDEYKVTPNEGMYSHSLFTTYMNKPDTSGGKTLNGLVKRRRSEWILFKTGYYDNIDKWCSESEGGSIVEKAIEVHNYLRSNGYHYAQTGGAVPRTSSKAIDCSSYVTWVLVEANVSGFTSGMAQWTSAKFATNPLGWQEVSANDAQPGDIVVYSGHVEIIAKNDPSSTQFRVYNCGSNNSINADGGNSGLPESSNSGRNKSTAVKILRVPQ
mgnify:CR=1 FL=1